MNITPEMLKISPEVAKSLKSNHPVVAFESAVITHGLPYPTNIELALEVERIAQEWEVTPATIALVDGQIRVGLLASDLQQLADSTITHKISGKDLAIALHNRWSGGTTVAASIIIARLAGIKVFATGGIGGVHRNSQFDVSNDLFELARQSVVVVCSGAKSILDISATLEVLETYGVAVFGYKTNIFPQFYSRGDASHQVYPVENAAEIARIYQKHSLLHSPGALLIANPLPDEQTINRDLLEQYIETSLVEAQNQTIHGAAITPFLLQRLTQLSDGKTMEANLNLLHNNAQLGSEIAKEIQKLAFTRQLSV